MGFAREDLLTDLLESVSRSFYKTLRILPRKIRPQISLAYLLARTTDTIADTDLVPIAERLDALQLLRDRIQGQTTTRIEFRALAGRQASSAEKVLLERCEESLSLMCALSAEDQARVRKVLEIITSGQELDLRRFEGAGADRVLSLETDADLDDYTYRVAGCVGEFWTDMCREHLFPKAPLDDAWLNERAVRFGKGLQLVNVLRDLAADLAKGRCYLPASSLRSAGLLPRDLRVPANESRVRPIYDSWLGRAEAQLQAGWEYTLALPWRQARVRLACAWPILIGVSTLRRLRTEPILDANKRIKVNRREVRTIFAHSVMFYALPSKWSRLPGWREL